MPSIFRKGDVLNGHGCFVKHNNNSGSSNVDINGLGVVRIGDSTTVHYCNTDSSQFHSSNQQTGSSTIKVNGISVARTGDKIACGSTNAGGSPNVAIN